jgi:hypothetical protein
MLCYIGITKDIKEKAEAKNKKRTDFGQWEQIDNTTGQHEAKWANYASRVIFYLLLRL